MDDNNKEQFRKLLHDKFNNSLKAVNEALVKHLEIVEKKQEANKSAYQKNQDNEEFMKKRKNMINNITQNINKEYQIIVKINITTIMNTENTLN